MKIDWETPAYRVIREINPEVLRWQIEQGLRALSPEQWATLAADPGLDDDPAIEVSFVVYDRIVQVIEASGHELEFESPFNRYFDADSGVSSMRFWAQRSRLSVANGGGCIESLPNYPTQPNENKSSGNRRSNRVITNGTNGNRRLPPWGAAPAAPCDDRSRRQVNIKQGLLSGRIASPYQNNQSPYRGKS